MNFTFVTSTTVVLRVVIGLLYRGWGFFHNQVAIEQRHYVGLKKASHTQQTNLRFKHHVLNLELSGQDLSMHDYGDI